MRIMDGPLDRTLDGAHAVCNACVMSKDKAGLDRILDESDAAVRAEISRLEVERTRVTARLDERIAKLRSVLPVGETLSLLNAPTAPATPMTRAPAKAPVSGARPRGERQMKIYEHILAHPEASYREIVVAVYGEYTELNYNSTRNAIASMKRNGWISGERGEWTVGKGVAA